MKTSLALVAAVFISLTAIGCDTQTTTKTTVEQKVETTPDSTIKTTTEKVEKSGDNPPPVKP